MSHALAGRLLKVIHLVVNPNQTCGVCGCYIRESVAFLGDVVSYAGTPVAILPLDQEKTFAQVDLGFLRSTLLSMGFGSSFFGWVELLYSGVQTAVKFNGYRTPFFHLSRLHFCDLSVFNLLFYCL